MTRLRKLARQATRDARDFDDLPFERQHQVRKRLKRLRYLAEFAAPAFERRAVDAGWTRSRRRRTRSAELVDLVLAGRRFARRRPIPDAAFAAGWLRAQAEASPRASRASRWCGCAGARPFW